VGTQTCSMCGWTGPQHKVIRWSGGQADWPRLTPWGSPLHGKWACRDKAACQERQAQRKEKTGG
jgi:hypothetical protein